MESESYSEDEAIVRLDSSELSKYINSLNYYVLHPYESEALVLVIGNSVELSDYLPKINTAYVEGMVKPLQRIRGLISNVLPLIRDKTLHDMLLDNQKEITQFFSKFSIPYGKDEDYTYSEKVNNPYYKDYKAVKKAVRNSLSEDKSKRVDDEDRGELFKTIAEGLKARTELNIPDARPDIDVFLEEGLARYRERKVEWDRWKVSKTPELTLEQDPRKYFYEKVLTQLADRICREGKK